METYTYTCINIMIRHPIENIETNFDISILGVYTFTKKRIFVGILLAGEKST